MFQARIKPAIFVNFRPKPGPNPNPPEKPGPTYNSGINKGQLQLFKHFLKKRKNVKMYREKKLCISNAHAGFKIKNKNDPTLPRRKKNSADQTRKKNPAKIFKNRIHQVYYGTMFPKLSVDGYSKQGFPNFLLMGTLWPIYEFARVPPKFSRIFSCKAQHAYAYNQAITFPLNLLNLQN